MNKFKLALLAWLVFMFHAAFAEEVEVPDSEGEISSVESKEKSKDRIGIRFGPSYSHITIAEGSRFKNPKNFGAKEGFYGGVVFDKALNDYLYIQPGYMFTQKGSKLGSERIDLMYAEVSLLLSARIPIFGKKNLAFKADAGGYFAFCALGNYYAVNSPDNNYRFCTENNELGLKFNQFDYGVKTGLGIEYKAFYLGMLYEGGLATVHYYVDEYREISAYNRAFIFELGYNFNLNL